MNQFSIVVYMTVTRAKILLMHKTVCFFFTEKYCIFSFEVTSARETSFSSTICLLHFLKWRVGEWVFSRRAAILKIVEKKSLGTRLEKRNLIKLEHTRPQGKQEFPFFYPVMFIAISQDCSIIRFFNSEKQKESFSVQVRYCSLIQFLSLYIVKFDKHFTGTCI